jgi:2-methylcitrate dehydratase PrpD
VTAIEHFAELISTAPREHQREAVTISRNALIDTIACMFAGSASPVAEKTLQSVAAWSSGSSAVIGQPESLNPPFAAMVNGASAHAFDYDDFDEVANAHPSAVIFPALLALAAERSVSGMDLLDAHIVGVEIMQRLGEAMNMDHYRRGWLSTLTLGTIGAAAACARLARFDRAMAADALSLGASMASGLTNQGGFLAKQLHPGLAAKNGVMASALAAAGITASPQTIDGPISLANTMGEHQPQKFTAAMSKLGNPWSIVEYGLITKAYPTCGYSHRAIDAAIDIHTHLNGNTAGIESILISVPDYYLDLLIYENPKTVAEAMFSAQQNVAAALVHGGFGLPVLTNEAIANPEVLRLCGLAKVVPRTPRDSQIIYDPLDPDRVEICFGDGSSYRGESTLLRGSPARPMSDAELRGKLEECLEHRQSPVNRDALWAMLSGIEELDELNMLFDLVTDQPG